MNGAASQAPTRTARDRAASGFRFLPNNRRQRTLLICLAASGLLLAIVLGNVFLDHGASATNLRFRNLGPGAAHPFGTDWLGRDMFVRTVQGLGLSLGIGVLASAVSVTVALILGLAAGAMGRWVDAFVSWLIDLFLSLPHLVTLIVVAFALGGGFKGVVIGVAVTHWPSLTRILRAEILQVRSSDYVQISRKLGRTRFWIARRHFLPHLWPQLFVGFLLLFPHAVLHEAAVTFLGFGLSPHQPAIGIILSESMQYLSNGMWWLALFPGISLLIMVRTFDILGENVRQLLDPHHAQE